MRGHETDTALLEALGHEAGCESLHCVNCMMEAEDHRPPDSACFPAEAGTFKPGTCTCAHGELARRLETMQEANRRKEWDGAVFCWRCDEVLIVDDQHFCHKCGARFLCDHDKGMTEYCGPCGRIHSD